MPQYTVLSPVCHHKSYMANKSNFSITLIIVHNANTFADYQTQYVEGILTSRYKKCLCIRTSPL